MKRLFVLVAALFACYLSNAQLTIYSNFDQQGGSATCVTRTIYTGNDVPGGLNDRIKSISLKKGFMATLAANTDGTGEGFSYIASVSDVNVNLANVLQDKISFIRVLPITNIKKKGAGEQNNVTVGLLNVSWFYDWGIQDVSVAGREFVPMAWGKSMATPAAIDAVTAKTGVTTFLGFNEPDGAKQANLNIDEAAALYKGLMRSGYRMGSPATTESQFRVWLSDFTTLANRDGSRIDFVCIHWYDWGNWLSTNNANPNPVDVFNRFKNHITAVYNLYQKPIWITEFHANEHRPAAIQEEFMKLVLPWLDADPRVERYAYFFGNDVPATSGGVLTGPGRIYAEHASADAYPQNVVDQRVFSDLVVWETSGQTLGGRGVADFEPAYLDPNLTAPSVLKRGAGAALPTTAASNGYWGGNEWSTTTAEAGIAANKFLTFSLKSTNGRSVSYNNINKFKIRVASNGPLQYQIDYQIDNGAFSPVATVRFPTTIPANSAANAALPPIDLSSIAALQNVSPDKTVTFRITPFAATGLGSFLFGAGAADTDVDFSLTGMLTSGVSGVKEPTDLSLSVYPSGGAADYLHAAFDPVSTNARIKIFALDGRLMGDYELEAGAKVKVIHTANLTAGIYLLMLQDKGRVQHRKFIKQ